MITFLRANAWLALVVGVVAVGLYQFVDPAPPGGFTLATGNEEGRYYQLGLYLKDELKKEGIDVNLVPTAGSGENMELLTDPENDVSIAFVQSGMEDIFDVGDSELASLGSLYYEPMWLFYREGLALDKLTSLQGHRVAAGEPGSGTRAVAEYLLKANGLLKHGTGLSLVDAGGEKAVQLLREGDVDAAFFTVSPQSELIQQLIGLSGVQFLDIRRAAAFTARFPFLSSVTISEGLLDLERDIPDTDHTTLASVATVVVNERFHPAFTPLVLEVLSRRLKRGGVLEKPGEFPSPANVGFTLTKEADHYFRYGPPFLQRYLPFWAASLADRLVIFVIPLLVIVVPLAKLAGPLYRWRIRSRIYRWYALLLEMDRKIAEGEIEDREAKRRKLEELADELASVDVPLSYSDELYQLKQHVEYVSRRLRP
ncbi:MAG: TAXI family TRAP transporter solute-binding subunit [Lysobacterales bacterium]